MYNVVLIGCFVDVQCCLDWLILLMIGRFMPAITFLCDR